MKLLKPVVISLCMVGATSLPALAATSGASNKSMQDRVTRLEQIIDSNQGSTLLAEPSLGKNWTNRIKVTGQINVDGMYSTQTNSFANSTGPNTSGKNSSNLYLNNSEINIDAMINDWVNAHISITGNDNDNFNVRNNQENPNNIDLDETYITIGNLAKNPFYGRFGREYIPFGHYTRHPLVAPLTQTLTETHATAAEVGFASANGFHGAAYAFRGRGQNTVSGTSRNITNAGAEVGYIYDDNANTMMRISAGYLRNMADVDAISNMYGVGNNSYNGGAVGAYTVDAGAQFGPFGLAADYVSALQRFNATDVSFNGRGAKPSAGNFRADYTFSGLKGMDNTVGISYQFSQEAVQLGMPHYRWQADYTMPILKDTNLQFAFFRDQDYNALDNGGNYSGSNATTYTGAVRLNVNF